MRHYINADLGLILFDITSEDGLSSASFTTEILTSHVAVYYRDNIWRSEVEGAWEIDNIARQLGELIHQCGAPNWMRALAYEELQKRVPAAF